MHTKKILFDTLDEICELFSIISNNNQITHDALCRVTSINDASEISSASRTYHTPLILEDQDQCN